MSIAIAPTTAGAHVRRHTSLLAGAEKRTLVWIAHRLPDAIGSDHLSALGLGALVAAGVVLAAVPFGAWTAAGVIACLALNWFGDSLDGTLARVRRQERPRYGYYVDHVIDVIGIACLSAGLAASTLMGALPALVFLAAYLLVSAESYLATHATGVFRISYLGVGPTELRVVLALGLIKAAGSPEVSISRLGLLPLFDVGGWIAAAGLAVVFLLSAVGNVQALYVAEPLPTRRSG